ncbi:MAG: nucleotidyltransferase family protein [Bdellovibrionales bacterium]
MFKHAFILCAGMGKRLRPYTDTMPKPMVTVHGKPIIDHTLDKLVAAGIKNATINLHYLGDVLKKHVENRDDITITFSEETDLLETGGGLKHALHTMPENEPFFIINGDAFWTENETNIFTQLSQNWSDDNMDILLALQPVEKMILTKGVGDYTMKNGKATRSLSQDGDLMFAGIRLCHPRVFEDSPEGAFSFLELMDKADKRGRLYGTPFQGDWHHISTPEELDRVNEAEHE